MRNRLPNPLPNTAASLGNAGAPAFHFTLITQWFAPFRHRRRPPPSFPDCAILGLDWAIHCLIDCAILLVHCAMDSLMGLGNCRLRLPNPLPNPLPNSWFRMPNRLPNALANATVPLPNRIAQSDYPINPAHCPVPIGQSRCPIARPQCPIAIGQSRWAICQTDWAIPMGNSVGQ